MTTPGVAASVRERAAEWALRLDGGALSERDHQALADWLAADPTHGAALEAAQRVWRELDDVSAAVDMRSSLVSEGQSVAVTHTRSSSAFSETLEFSGSERVVSNAPSGMRRGRVAAAAVALACFAAVVFRTELSIALHADARTAVGETKTLALEDGSRVQLNTNSAAVIRYTPRGRDIELLAGEAAFEVAHDAARPFRVHFGEGTTTAVGTAFQVRASEKEAVVTVTEGHVQVRSRDTSLDLHAGQQASYAHDGFRERAKNVDVALVSAWQRGRVSFVDQPLGDVVNEIDRYHPGRIVILDDSLAEQRVSGVFDITEPLIALAAIERNLGLHSTYVTSYLVLLGR